MNKHPSGKPINRQTKKLLGFIRIPYSEPLTPGLRKSQPTNAIGFTAVLHNTGYNEPIDGKK